MSTIFVGKRQLPLKDVAAVCLSGSQVALNAAALSGMEGSSQGTKVPAAEENFTESGLHPALARAIMLLKCASFLEGRSGVRAEVAQFLTDLLNHGIVPVLPPMNALACLAQFCISENGSCFFGLNSEKVPYKQALSQTSLVIPGLFAKEVEAFKSQGVLVGSAIFSLSVHWGEMLVDVADCVAALSCEAIRASATPFGATIHDVCRPHKGQVRSAGNLRLLLDHSLLIGSSKRKTADPTSFQTIPQQHGPAREVLGNARRSAQVEQNSAEAEPPGTQGAKSVGGFSCQPMIDLIAQAQNAVRLLAVGSTSRVSDTLQNFDAFSLPRVDKTNAELADVSNELEDVARKFAKVLGSNQGAMGDLVELAQLLWETVVRAHQALALEAAYSLALLGQQEREALKAAEEVAKKKKEREAEVLARLAAEGKKASAGGEKKKEKVKKDQSAGGMVLGKGTATFRSWFGVACEGNVQECVSVLHPKQLTLEDKLGLLLTSTNQICKPKIPKGTRDSDPEQMSIREKCFDLIKGVFLRHGAVGIDTPVFERKEILTGKYGEDSKLIYDLADQGGEMLSLRYDLTVPFARFLAMHKITNIKRYHIARVYRRDNPAMNRGRFREFYQCDYDIAGTYAQMVPDSEAIKVLSEVLTSLNIGPFKIKLNHRKLLDGLMAVCGVPATKFRSICSAIDKLDKEPWDAVESEMVNQKGLDKEVAARIGTYVTRPPGRPKDFLAELEQDSLLSTHQGAKEAFEDLRLMFNYCEALGCLDYVSFDLSLARGLDYYTGVIYEAMLTDTDRVGSIAAGGRYDGLIGMFSGTTVPAVGVSIGIERILTILEEMERERQGIIRSTKTEVLVASIGSNLLHERMLLCAELWRNDVYAEFLYDLAPKPKKQMDHALENKIPFVLWIGESEIAAGEVKLKDMEQHTEEIVKRHEIVAHTKRVIAARNASGN